jgi:hypothetical protein
MILATKIPKNKGFTKAFVKTKLGYLLDKEIAKGDFLWQYDYKPKLEDNAWHPSGHCTPTLQELYEYAVHREHVEEWPDGTYPLKIEQRKLEPTLGKIFQVGHFWHQYLQEICIRAGLCTRDNVERRGSRGWDPVGESDGKPVYKDFHWVTGSADICPLDIPGYGPYLIDFKTMGSHVFRQIDPYPDALAKWECQLNVYMDFFDVERAMIVAINKDSPHDFKEFEFVRNEALIEAMYLKWQMVAQCLDEEIPPTEFEEVALPLKGLNA